MSLKITICSFENSITVSGLLPATISQKIHDFAVDMANNIVNFDQALEISKAVFCTVPADFVSIYIFHRS